MKKIRAFFLIFAFGFILRQNVFAQMTVSASTDIVSEEPVFMADLSNPNDFSLFANGGWDGGWYVGFNTCWIQKLPAPPEGNYQKAFIGAKLGRMKNIQAAGKAPWERKAVPGEIYLSIASTPSWNRSQSYFLTATDDIPLEPDSEVAYEGVGESRWFWTEVPLKLVNLKGDNYVALWSPSETLNSISSAPILAAGWGTKEVDSWMNTEVKGLPPKDASKALATPVTIFEPAIALKLIPQQKTEIKPQIRIAKIEEGKARGKLPPPKVVWIEADGVNVERAWIEVSPDGKKWTRYGRTGWNVPFCFTLRTEQLPMGPDGKSWVRAVAANVWENTGTSEPVNVFETR